MTVPVLLEITNDLVSVNWTLLAQLIAFLILLYFLVRLLYTPLTNALNTRATKIRTGLAAAEEARRAAEEAQQRTQALLDQGKAQAQEILRQASASAETMRQQIVNEARNEAEKVIERGKLDINRERQAAVDELRGIVGELAIQAAGQIVQRSLDSAENRRLIDDAIGQSDVFSAMKS